MLYISISSEFSAKLEISLDSEEMIDSVVVIVINITAATAPMVAYTGFSNNLNTLND